MRSFDYSSYLMVFFLVLSVITVRGQQDLLSEEEIRERGIREMTVLRLDIKPGGVKDQVRKEVFTYDQEGKLVGRVDFGKGNSPETSAVFRYDEKGNKVFQELRQHRGNKSLSVSWEYEYDGTLVVEMHNSNTPMYKTYAYDSEGRLISEKDFNETDELVSHITYQWDEEGKLLEQTEKLQFLIRSKTYQYDSEGRKSTVHLTREHNFEGNTITREKETYEYDDQGHLAKYMYWNQEGELTTYTRYYHDPAGNLIREELGETIYVYQYDERNNLTEKKKKVRGNVTGIIQIEYKFR